MSGRILICGAGAVGGAVGAALVDAGHSVDFVDMDKDHVEALRDPARGLVVEGPVRTRSGAVRAWLPDELAGRWDKVMLCVKAHHTAAAAAMIEPHLAKDGCVLTLQNGLAACLAADVLGRERFVIGFVNFGADRTGDGRIMLGNRGAVALGEWDGRTTVRLGELFRLLGDFEPDVIATPDIWAFIWGKLAYAALLSARRPRRQASPQRSTAPNCCRFGANSRERRSGRHAPKASSPPDSTGSTPRRSDRERAPPKARRAFAQSPIFIAAAPSPIRASGATSPFTAARPRSMRSWAWSRTSRPRAASRRPHCRD